jgi:hypothetical protein
MNVELCVGEKRTSIPCMQMFAVLGSADTDQFGGLTMYDYPSKGVLVYVNEQDTVVTIFLYPAGVDGYSESVFSLPGSLSFTQIRSEVRGAFGSPQTSGITKAGQPWDRFEFPRYALHLEYDGTTGTIRQVTLMASLPEILSERPSRKGPSQRGQSSNL